MTLVVGKNRMASALGMRPMALAVGKNPGRRSPDIAIAALIRCLLSPSSTPPSTPSTPTPPIPPSSNSRNPAAATGSSTSPPSAWPTPPAAPPAPDSPTPPPSSTRPRRTNKPAPPSAWPSSNKPRSPPAATRRPSYPTWSATAAFAANWLLPSNSWNSTASSSPTGNRNWPPKTSVPSSFWANAKTFWKRKQASSGYAIAFGSWRPRCGQRHIILASDRVTN